MQDVEEQRGPAEGEKPAAMPLDHAGRALKQADQDEVDSDRDREEHDAGRILGDVEEVDSTRTVPRMRIPELADQAQRHEQRHKCEAGDWRPAEHTVPVPLKRLSQRCAEQRCPEPRDH